VIEIGRRLRLAVQPADPQHTHHVPAGSISFGVESRTIEPDAEFLRTLPTLYADAAPDVVIPADIDLSEFVDDGFVATGPSIHVYDSKTGNEYLRFDLFDREPHYHYLTPEAVDGYVNRLCVIDTVMVTDLTAFAMNALRNRLREMLDFAGAEQLATTLDPATVATALDEVEQLVQAHAVTPAT
jgi:hypothetical protein